MKIKLRLCCNSGVRGRRWRRTSACLSKRLAQQRVLAVSTVSLLTLTGHVPYDEVLRSCVVLISEARNRRCAATHLVSQLVLPPPAAAPAPAPPGALCEVHRMCADQVRVSCGSRGCHSQVILSLVPMHRSSRKLHTGPARCGARVRLCDMHPTHIPTPRAAAHSQSCVNLCGPSRQQVYACCRLVLGCARARRGPPSNQRNGLLGVGHGNGDRPR